MRSLLEAVGNVTEEHNGNLAVTLGGETEVVRPPRLRRGGDCTSGRVALSLEPFPEPLFQGFCNAFWRTQLVDPSRRGGGVETRLLSLRSPEAPTP